jgi:hypothetical protein
LKNEIDKGDCEIIVEKLIDVITVMREEPWEVETVCSVKAGRLGHSGKMVVLISIPLPSRAGRVKR